MARSEGFQIGDRVGPYELLSHVGSGGFASVWLARRTGPGGFEVKVAIKLIRTDLGTDPLFERMFIDEAKVAALINHPNVVKIFELGAEAGTLYMAMEYVPGRSLGALRNMAERVGRTIPLPILMRIVADTCAGLHAAHELARDGKPLAVIHRDVSPENILVSDDGAVKLIDFGVAKANDRLANTATGLAKGKVRYMPPEQAMAKPVDRRADIWAVAATAFDLIEGHPVFDGPNDVARLHALVGASPVPPLSAWVPRAYASILEKALSRDIEARWATAAEMCAAIERALVNEGEHVTPAAVATFFGEWLQTPEHRDSLDDVPPLNVRLAPAGAAAETGDIAALETQGAPSVPRPMQVETLGALDSSVLPTTSRFRIGTVAATALSVGIFAGVGLWMGSRGTHLADPAPATVAPPPTFTLEPVAPTATSTSTPTPTSTATSTATSTSAATVDAPRGKAPRVRPAPRKPPVTGTSTPTPAPAAASPPSRAHYDDVIQ